MSLVIISVITFLAGCCIGWYYRSTLIPNDAYINIQQFHERVQALELVLNRLTPRNEHDLFTKVIIKVSAEVMLKSNNIRGGYPGLRLTYALLKGYKSRLSIGMRDMCEKYIEILEDWQRVDERRVG